MCESRKCSHRSYSILSLPYTIFKSHPFFPYHLYMHIHYIFPYTLLCMWTQVFKKITNQEDKQAVSKCLFFVFFFLKKPLFHLQGFLGVAVSKSGPKGVITHMQEVRNFSVIYSHAFSWFLMITQGIIYRLQTDMFPFLRTAIKHQWKKEIIFFLLASLRWNFM